PRLWSWFQDMLSDPLARMTLISAIWRLGVIFGCALLGEWVIRYLLRRPLSVIERRVTPANGNLADPAETTPSDIDPGDIEPHHGGMATKPGRDFALLRRVPLAILHFALELLPVVAFAMIGNALLSTPLADGAEINAQTIRLAGIALVNAYVLTSA